MAIEHFCEVVLVASEKGYHSLERLSDIEKEINKLDAAIKMAKEQQEVVQEELKELRKEADRFGISSIDMQMRRRVAENAQKSLDLITAELEKLNIERRARPRIAIVEKAKVKE